MSARAPGAGAPAPITEHSLSMVSNSIVVLDLEGRVLRWAGASERLYGLKASAAEGQGVAMLFDEAFGACLPALLEGGTWEAECCRMLAQGRQGWVRVRRSLRRDDAGLPRDIVETAVPSGCLKQARTALDQLHSRFESLFDAVSVCLLELDLCGVREYIEHLTSAGAGDIRAWLQLHPEDVIVLMEQTMIVDVNARTLALFGAGVKADMLCSISRFWPASDAGMFLQSVLAILAGTPQFTFETSLRDLAGREWEASCAICHAHEVLQDKVIVTVIDLSDKKREVGLLQKNNTLYHNMFHAPGVSNWMLDNSRVNLFYDALRAQGVDDLVAHAAAHPAVAYQLLDLILVDDVNDATLELFGIPARTDVIGGSIAPYWLAERSRVFLEAVAAMYTTQISYGNETPMRTYDGREIWVVFNITASHELQAANRTLVTIVDITARVQAQNALRTMQANIAHGARISSLGELAASIACEVQKPLASIIASSVAMARQFRTRAPALDSIRAITGQIMLDANRAADIIRRIREMAVPHVMTRRSLSPNRLIEECMLLVAHEAQRRGIGHMLLLTPDMPDIDGDAIELLQVLVNLVLNAFHSMKQTERPHLTVRTRWRDAGQVRIDIEDNGPGMSDLRCANLFQRFFTAQGEGMDPGLAMCRTIIASHDGSVEVQNLPAGGTCVTVCLPLP